MQCPASGCHCSVVVAFDLDPAEDEQCGVGVSSGVRDSRAPARRETPASNLPLVEPAQLARLYPTLYHMAEDGTWPSIRDNGLLSTQAIVDLYQPDDPTRAEILSSIRRKKITLTHNSLGPITIRDQLPAKFLTICMTDGTDPADFLHALNSRVFFWLSQKRLKTLLNAKHYRALQHTVLHVDTAALIRAYADRVQLAPYNTGSMQVPNAPKRDPETFTSIADYPYEKWAAKRGSSGDPVVELTIDHAVPDVVSYVTKVWSWADGQPVKTLYKA